MFKKIFVSKGTKRLKLRENVTFAVSMKICGNKCPTPQFGSINLCASVNFYICQKKGDRQKNYTPKHVIMKIGFHMYQNWSNIWYKPPSLHFRLTSTSQTALTTMTPCIAAPENATVGTTSVDIWRWAFQSLGGRIPMLPLWHLLAFFRWVVLWTPIAQLATLVFPKELRSRIAGFPICFFLPLKTYRRE